MSANKEILDNGTSPHPPDHEPHGSAKRSLPRPSLSTSAGISRSSSLPRSLQGPRLWRSPGSVRAATSKSTLASEATVTAKTSTTEAPASAGEERKRKPGKEETQTKNETEEERKEDITVETEAGTGNDVSLVSSDTCTPMTEKLEEDCARITAPSLPAESPLQEAPKPTRTEAATACVEADVSEEKGRLVEENNGTQEEERLSLATETEDVPIAEMELEAAALDHDIPLPSPPPELSPSMWTEGIPESSVETPPLPPPPPPPPPPLEAEESEPGRVKLR